MANKDLNNELTPDTEPATKHDITEGGVMGAVGGAVVGALAGGPVGAVIGAIAGGAASAGAVNVVDKHDHDYTKTTQASQTTVGTDSDATYGTATTADAYGTTSDTSGYATSRTNADGTAVIPVVEEELEVGKRQVQAGGARVHTSVVETPVEEQVRLRKEHVTVDRRPVDRAATDADLSGLGERSFEVIETDEVPVVSKEARVVEEVVVGKTATERTETVRDTVRRTDVEVERLDSEDVRGTTR